MEVSGSVVQPPLRSSGKTGRPLSFDRATALEQAMLAFWRYGYETTSIVDLTKAMGISAPSLYAAFGDKKRLFLEAVRLYAGDPRAMAAAIADASTAYEAARDILIAGATCYTGARTPRGCLLTSATASGSLASADVQQAVAQIRIDTKLRLRDRIERDIAAGVLPQSTDAAGLSGLVMAVILGMSALARDGIDRADLMDIVAATMLAWPATGTVGHPHHSDKAIGDL